MIRFITGIAVFLLLAGNIAYGDAEENVYAPPCVAGRNLMEFRKSVNGDRLPVGDVGQPRSASLSEDNYRAMATDGNAEAQYRIGMMYGEGHGVAQDLAQAYAWLDIAARQGLQKAAGKRDLIAGQATRPQFYAAQRLKRDRLQNDGIIAK